MSDMFSYKAIDKLCCFCSGSTGRQTYVRHDFKLTWRENKRIVTFVCDGTPTQLPSSPSNMADQVPLCLTWALCICFGLPLVWLFQFEEMHEPSYHALLKRHW